MPFGKYSAMRLGIPQPRLTYAPSVNSCAARCAICSRVSRGFAATGFSWLASPGITESFRLHDAVHENRGRNHIFRIDRAHRNNFFRFHDGGFRSHGHDGIEVSCGETIRQVAQRVGFLRLDERIVRVDGHFQDAALSADHALFFSRGDFGADTNSGVKTGQAGSRGAHAFAKNSLGHEFQRHFLRGVAVLKMIGVRPGERRDDVLDLIVLEHQAELAFARAAIIGDRCDVFRSLARECLNQIVRKARATKPAEHDSRAIGNIGYRRIEAWINFLLHRAPIRQVLAAILLNVSALERSLAATPLWSSQRAVSVAPKSCSSKARRSDSSSTSTSRPGLRRTITRAPALPASARCFAKLPFPKCEGKSVGGVRRIAFVPVPSREGTMTRAGDSNSSARRSSMSSGWINGRSSGTRSTARTPSASQILEAASTESLSEIWRSSRKVSQPFSLAMRSAGR